jgi:hypothetical protein
MNAELIKQGMPQRERLQYLRNMVVEQMNSLINSAAVERLNEKLSTNQPEMLLDDSSEAGGGKI